MPTPRHTRAWIAIVAIAAALGVGTWALVRLVPPAEGTRLGERAPDFRTSRPAVGDSINIRRNYAGHVTLINIWATWCGPCKKEMPSMERLYRTYRERGFRVAAISIDRDGPDAVLEFAHRGGFSFDILHDRSDEIERAYQTVGVPESFLVDRHGRISYLALGAEEWDSSENRQRVERLLAAEN